MMAMIMGSRDSEVLDRACDLGLAFQLTNIARDVIDDARAGRVYVPSELLARYGVSQIDADDRLQWPKLHAAALDLLAVADDYYASAYEGLAALPPRSAWAIAAARRVYGAIGNKLRSGGPAEWEQRISTTRNKKMGLVALSLGDVAFTRFGRSGARRSGLWQRPV
jgi:phytoene synthase